MKEEQISQETSKKLQLYNAAVFLFEKGRSHPQIIELLSKFESDRELLSLIVDNAMNEKWDNLYAQTQILFSEGRTYGEVLSVISLSESDEGIARWICGSWYEQKTRFMEALIDGQTNRNEGVLGMIVSSLGVIFMFYVNAGWIGKTLWITALVVSFLLWMVGRRQHTISRRIQKFFSQSNLPRNTRRGGDV